MNQSGLIIYVALTLIIFVFTPIKQTIAQKGKATPTNRIQNFRAVDISDTELQVIVEYTYVTKTGTNSAFIHAMPRDAAGVFDRRALIVEQVPLVPGTKRISLKITKRPDSKNFTTESIRICMIADRSSILCEDFAFTKSWKASTEVAKIVSFETSNSKVKKGGSVTLSWKTENADNVRLGIFGSKDFRKVQPSGSQTVSPEKATTYVLMAGRTTKGPMKMESKKLKVDVIYDPVIGRFWSYPPIIRRGQKAKLIWEAYAAERVTLNGTPVSPVGEKFVSPTRTQNYTLIAQTGNKVIKEHYNLHVSPFPLPTLSSPFSSVELCKSIDTSGESARCVSSDGPFYTGDKIHMIVSLKTLPKGQHKVKRILYKKDVLGSGSWKKIHQEESSFQNPKNGTAQIDFEIANPVKGVLKIELILDGRQSTQSEIQYCVECPGHDEW